MDTLTKAQLVKAMIEYYKRAVETPDDFDMPGDPVIDAVDAVEYMFEIASEQTKEG